MYNNLFKKIFLIITIFCSFSFLFAQSDSDEVEDVEEVDDVEALEKEANSKPQIDMSLQNNFIIIEQMKPHDLNPHTTSYASDAQLFTGLYEGLFSYNPVSLDPQYAIALDYRLSRDKKRWTFTLNDKAYFSNGDRITAEDVRASWLQLLSTPNAPYSSMLDVIKGAAEYRQGTGKEEDVGIYVNSDTSLSIALVKPANYLPKVLCHPAFSVVHRNPTVYSGPYYLYDCDEVTYILKKNPYYWDKGNTILEEITILQCDDLDENAYYFNTGMVDWVSAGVNTQKLLNTKVVQFNAEFATAYFFFKNSKAKPKDKTGTVRKISVWDYPEFRQALLEAFPWDTMREGYAVPATTFVYPIGNYPTVEGFNYTDLNEAKNLMAAAREKYGIPADERLILTLEISENSFAEDRLQVISDNFSQLGVTLKIKKVPVYFYINNVPLSDSDLFCYTWIGDFADPLTFLDLFRSDSTLNDSGWMNSEFDELLEQAALASADERYKYLGQAETILLDSCEIIPLHHPVIYNVLNLDEVGGWAPNAFDIHPFKYLFKKQPAPATGNIVKK